jgi:hypothetical protein
MAFVSGFFKHPQEVDKLSPMIWSPQFRQVDCLPL